MVDIENEVILSLNEATRHLPKVEGKRPHLSSVWRWCKKGLGSPKVQLEYARIGRRIVTSKEALNRFANRLAEADQQTQLPPPAKKPKSRTSKQRERAIAKAERELAEAGI